VRELLRTFPFLIGGDAGSGLFSKLEDSPASLEPVKRLLAADDFGHELGVTLARFREMVRAQAGKVCGSDSASWQDLVEYDALFDSVTGTMSQKLGADLREYRQCLLANKDRYATWKGALVTASFAIPVAGQVAGAGAVLSSALGIVSTGLSLLPAIETAMEAAKDVETRAAALAATQERAVAFAQVEEAARERVQAVAVVGLNVVGGLLEAGRLALASREAAAARPPGPSPDYSWRGIFNRVSEAADGVPQGAAAPREVTLPGSRARKLKIRAPGRDGYGVSEMASAYAGEEIGGVWAVPLRYVDPAELPNFSLTVQEGKVLSSRSGTPFDTTKANMTNDFSRAAIFVMDRDGAVYVFNHHLPGDFHHSNFLRGRPTAAAGEIQVQSGVIRRLNLCSGHYKQGAWAMEQLVGRLLAMGADLSRASIEYGCRN
jgi:hypothetical protein